MLIRLTEAHSNLGMVLGHSVVLMCRRDPQDKITTHVMTGIMGPNGLVAFQVKETPEEIALMINAAEKSDIPPALLGLGKSLETGGPLALSRL